MGISTPSGLRTVSACGPGGSGTSSPDEILRLPRRQIAALFEQTVKQRHEFRGERELAVRGPPTARENDHPSLSERHLDNRRRLVIE
jgi:hypothetical protein